MKLFTTTALAALLTASTAIAASHESGDSDNGSMDSSQSESTGSDNGSMDSSQSESTGSDMDSGTDMSTGADEMYDGDDSTASDSGSSDSDDLIRARDITGGAIYTMDMASGDNWDVTIAEETVGPNWNEIGEIEDLVMSRTGQMTGVVAEIGGFLDIGDKHVLLPINDVKLVPADDMTYSIVTRFSEEELSELENIDESPWY